jgi:hypothetical protein
MHPFATTALIFTLIFLGALAGMALRQALPQEHFGSDAKDTVRLAIGLIVTMTSLVLGMLVSSAKTYYDNQKNQVAVMSSQIVSLDDLLTRYGPEAKQARSATRLAVEQAVDRIWPKEKSRLFQLRPEDNEQNVDAELRMLVPKNDLQSATKNQIAAAISEVKKTYWLMFLQSEQTSISVPLLIVVTLWLVTIFISFGVFAPPNATVIVTLIICAMAASAAIFIIMEMYAPFSGIMKISPTAVHDALHQMAIDR